MKTIEEKIKAKTIEGLELITNWYKSDQQRPLEFNSKLGVINAELKGLKEQRKFKKMAEEIDKAASILNDFVKVVKCAGITINEACEKLFPNQNEKILSKEDLTGIRCSGIGEYPKIEPKEHNTYNSLSHRLKFLKTEYKSVLDEIIFLDDELKRIDNSIGNTYKD